MEKLERNIRVESIRLQNLNGIDLKEFDPKNKSVWVIGQNGVGKSTMLNVMELITQGPGKSMWANFKPLPNPDKNGTAKVLLTDLQGHEYVAEVVVKPNGKNQFKITSDSGSAKTIAEVRRLFEEPPTIDVVGFLENQKTAAGRRKNEKEFFTPMLELDLEDFKKQIKNLSDKKSSTSQELKAVSTLIEDSGVSMADLNKELVEKPTEELQKKITASEQFDLITSNLETKKTNVSNKIQELKGEKTTSLTEIDLEIKQAEERLQALRDKRAEKATQYDNRISDCRSQLEDINDQIDDHIENAPDENQLEELRNELRTIMEYNASLATLRANQERMKNMINLSSEVDDLKEQIDKLKADMKSHIVEKSGSLPERFALNLTEDDTLQLEFFWNEKWTPIHELPKSQQMSTGVFIGIEACKKSRLGFQILQDASLLDEDSIKLLLQMAEKAGGIQLFLEEVMTQQNLQVELLVNEDGEFVDREKLREKYNG